VEYITAPLSIQPPLGVFHLPPNCARNLGLSCRCPLKISWSNLSGPEVARAESSPFWTNNQFYAGFMKTALSRDERFRRLARQPELIAAPGGLCATESKPTVQVRRARLCASRAVAQESAPGTALPKIIQLAAAQKVRGREGRLSENHPCFLLLRGNCARGLALFYGWTNTIL
jgi:hypothetical protein